MTEQGLECPLYSAARIAPHDIALDDAGKTYSYRQLDKQVRQLCGWLQEKGVQERQHLLVISEDKAQLIRLLLACLRLGCLFIPVNPRLPLQRLQHLIEQSDARWLINDTDLVLPVQQATVLQSPGWESLEQQTAQRSDAGNGNNAPLRCPMDADRPLTGVFTSGTSGNPKLALHSFRNHHFSALGSRSLIPLEPGDAWAVTLPLYHIGGLAIIFRCLQARACMIVPAADRDLQQFLLPTTALKTNNETHLLPTHLSAVTTQLLRLRDQGIDLEKTGLRYLLLGGSAFPTTLLRWLEQQSITVMISYGLTEMGSQVVTGPLNATSRLQQLLPHRELKLNSDGEILLRGDTLFQGYYRQGSISRPLDDDGWFHSRDLGQQHADGSLRIIGRLDNQFVSGGENIQPETIEALMRKYSGIDECYVVPIADPEFGQRPVCFLRRTAIGIDERNLINWLRERLPGYMVPRRYLFFDDSAPDLKVSRSRLTRIAEEI